MVSPQSLGWRYGKAAVWNAIGAVTTQGVTFLTNILIANLLGRDIFGRYSIIQTTIVMIVGIAQLATGITATRYIAELRLRDKERAGRILGLCSTVSFFSGIAATVALATSSDWLATEILKVPDIVKALLISSALVFFSVMNTHQIGALAGLESFKTLAQLGAISGTIQLTATVGFAWIWGLDGAILGLVFAGALRWWLHARAVKSEGAAIGIYVSRRIFKKDLPVFLRFALPAAMSGFSTLPALWLSNAFLVRQSHGLMEMALFAAANNLRVIVLFLPNLLNGAGVSIINNQLSDGENEKYSKIFWMNVILTSMTTISTAAIIAVIGKFLLRLYGQEFVLGYPVLLVLLGAAVLEGLTLGPYQIIQSCEKMWLSLFVISLPRDLLLAISAYHLTPTYGAVGLAYAYVLAWFFAAVVVSLSAYRIGRRLILTKGIWRMVLNGK